MPTWTVFSTSLTPMAGGHSTTCNIAVSPMSTHTAFKFLVLTTTNWRCTRRALSNLAMVFPFQIEHYTSGSCKAHDEPFSTKLWQSWVLNRVAAPLVTSLCIAPTLDIPSRKILSIFASRPFSDAFGDRQAFDTTIRTP
jgi:hypothetical protein